jgi:lysine biosynthesis protein LysW
MADGELYDAVCPECDFAFQVEDPAKGEVVACADCGLNLMVTAVDPDTRRVGLELTANKTDDWGQ